MTALMCVNLAQNHSFLTKNVTASAISLVENEFSPATTANGFVAVVPNSNMPRCLRSKNFELVLAVTPLAGFVRIVDGLNYVNAKPLKTICTAYCGLFIVFPSY